MMEININTKKCNKCGDEKEIHEFRNCKGGKYGVRSDCRKCELKSKKTFREKNKEKIATSYKRWATENKEKKNKINLEYFSKKYKDPLFKFKHNTRALIWQIFKSKKIKKDSTCEKILGCTFEHFIKHIEMQFHPGMSWDNRSEWHLDHIIPIGSAKTFEKVIELNHYTNLRPLWADENRKKSDKIIYLI
jgi:hypothetical protein